MYCRHTNFPYLCTRNDVATRTMLPLHNKRNHAGRHSSNLYWLPILLPHCPTYRCTKNAVAAPKELPPHSHTKIAMRQLRKMLLTCTQVVGVTSIHQDYIHIWEVLMLVDSEAAVWVSGVAETVDYFR